MLDGKEEPGSVRCPDIRSCIVHCTSEREWDGADYGGWYDPVSSRSHHRKKGRTGRLGRRGLGLSDSLTLDELK